MGTGELGSMGEVVNMSMLFTVGGLLVLAGVFTNYPNAIGKPLATPSTATLATWMVLVGGVASTLTYLTGEFTANAVAASEVEDVVANSGGFYLTGAAMFYLASIGTILSTMVVIRTGISSTGRTLAAEETSDMASYTLTSGSSTTIRDLIGRGVGVDTALVVSETEANEGGSTIIAVDSALHNDEIIDFPVAGRLLAWAPTCLPPPISLGGPDRGRRDEPQQRQPQHSGQWCKKDSWLCQLGPAWLR